MPYGIARLRVIIAGICALILTVGLARFAYTPMLPVMRAQADLSALAGGWLATVNYLGYMSGALLAASISSLDQKFILYRIGLVTALITTTAMGLTQDVMIWAVLRYLSGLSSTAGLLLASGLVLNWLIRHDFRPQLGLHFVGMGLGIILSGLAVETMAGQVPWDQQWQILGGLGIVFFLPAWFWLPAPGQLKVQNVAPTPPPGRKWMLLFIASYFCAGFGYVISATFIVAIVEKLPLMAGHGNWVWVIVGLTAIPSCFVWDRAAHEWGQMPALMLAFGLELVSILLPAISDGVVANVLAAILYGGTFVGIVSLTLSLIGRCFPQNPAKAMARLTLSYGVAQISAPALAGVMAQTSGSYRDTLFVAAAIMVAGMALLFQLWRHKP